MDRDKIEEHLLNQIDNWDLDTLIEYVRDDMAGYYKQLSNQELLDEFLEYGEPSFVEQHTDEFLSK